MTKKVTEPQTTYVITGATGLVGSHLAERLSQNNSTVRCLVRQNSDLTFLKKLGVEFVYGDITDKKAVDAAIKDADIVFHCAAMVSDWATREEMVHVNVGGTENIIDACLHHDVKRMVMVSSLAVLGMGKQENASETEPYVYTGDNYNYTKIESEKRVSEAVRQKQLPGVILRPPYIYGPRDRQLLPRIIPKLKDGTFPLIGGGKNPISLVYVKNLVDALLRAAKENKAIGQIYHITDGHDISRKEFVCTLAKKLGYPEPTKDIPGLVAQIACPIIEFLHKLSGSKTPPLLNKFRMKFMHTYLTFDISKARVELGYEPPYSFSEGLDETLAWFKQSEETPQPVGASS